MATEIICCGRVVQEKKGKRVCSNCGAEFHVKRHEGKRTFRKISSRSHYTFGDQIYLLGWLMMIGAVAALGSGAAHIWEQGLSAFKMGVFTLILIVGFIGFALTGGFKRRRKA